MSLLAPPGIGLVGTLAFHAEPAVTESVARPLRGGIFNTSRRLLEVSTNGGATTATVLQSRASTAKDLTGSRIGFGFFPKISTPVENIVEKQPISPR